MNNKIETSIVTSPCVVYNVGEKVFTNESMAKRYLYEQNKQEARDHVITLRKCNIIDHKELFGDNCTHAFIIEFKTKEDIASFILADPYNAEEVDDICCPGKYLIIIYNRLYHDYDDTYTHISVEFLDSAISSYSNLVQSMETFQCR